MDVIIKPLDDSTLDLFKNCFDLNGSPKSRKKIKWQFLENPPASCFVDIAYDESKSRTTAIYAISSVYFKVGDKKVLGAQSLDTMTDINYRGQGFFTRLANNVYTTAAESNVSLVYGFPNGNSIYGFKKKLAWEVLDPLPFLIRPLKTNYFTSRIKWLKFIPNINIPIKNFRGSKRYNINKKNSFPEDVNTIWDKFSQSFKVGVIRDKNYLEWRYISKPDEYYSIAHITNLNDEYLGYIIYTVKEKHNGKIAYIMELIYDPAIPDLGDMLLKYAMNDIKSQNADCILSWCMDHSPNSKAYKKNFFLKMPVKLRPIELHFGARSFDSKTSSLVNDRSNWYLSYSDSDTV
jgi:predicted acetyltransferase